jgi:hypothetical protein
LRLQPISQRKIALTLVTKASGGIQLCEHLEEDGPFVLEHAA